MTIQLRNPRPLHTKILVELKKDADKRLTEKYTFNSNTKSWDELSQQGFVLSQLTPAKYNELFTRENHATQEAYVLKLGQNANFDTKDDVKIGDCVLVVKYSGEDRDDIVEGKVCRFIIDRDIICVFDGENRLDNPKAEDKQNEQ